MIGATHYTCTRMRVRAHRHHVAYAAARPSSDIAIRTPRHYFSCLIQLCALLMPICLLFVVRFDAHLCSSSHIRPLWACVATTICVGRAGANALACGASFRRPIGPAALSADHTLHCRLRFERAAICSGRRSIIAVIIVSASCLGVVRVFCFRQRA